MALSQGTRLGPYEIVAQIGEGGMGEVYRATDTNLKRAVAIKVLPEVVGADPERLARFQREAEVLAKLNHPNIAQIYGLERSNGTTALVMELVDGPTLADRIAQGPMPFDEALPIAEQIAEALEAAHEQGIVHRDLKPANIKVRPDGTVKVLDFGLAKALEHVHSASSAPSMSHSPTITSPALMSGIGVLLGTAAYMSPEQAKGRAVDKRADIWAFGCVLYEMLSGERLFDGEDLTETLAAVVKERPDLSAVPLGVRRLIGKCLEKDPKSRLRDIGDAWELLDDVANSPPSSTMKSAQWWLALAWTLTGFAALAVAGLSLVHFNETAPERAVVRSNIAPPENTVFDFDVTVGPVVISPDGRLLAFTALSAEGRRQLWLRPLDSPTARPLDGTDGAMFPFWSPDGRSVGFFRGGGRLLKVNVSGGPPVLITDAGFVRGASWGSGDTIVFDQLNTLWAVPANGGQPVRRSTPDTASGETAHRSPSFLPDGRHYLYWVGGKNQIRVGSLDSEESLVVVEGATSNAIYANGYLLFLRETTLLAEPFDSATRVVTGDAVPIADNIVRLAGEPRGVFTASENGTLVYQTGGTEAVLTLAWFDRAGKRVSTIADLGDAQALFLSPDHGSALVAISDSQRRLGLFRIDLGSGKTSRLTANSPGSTSAVWSPNGTEIMYSRTRDGRTELWRKPATSLAEGSLVYAGKFERVTSWSHDGRHLLLAGEGVRALALTPEAPGLSSEPLAFATERVQDGDRVLAYAQNGQFSPDGRWVAYQVGASGIFVDAFPGGGSRRQVSEQGTLPRWRSDQKELYYLTSSASVSAGMVTAVEVSESGGLLQFGASRAIMGPLASGRPYSYDVAANGERFLALVTSQQRAAQPLTLVQNWVAALKQR
jgi:serine/threonine protein kinase/Tol biopolymer transport system component